MYNHILPQLPKNGIIGSELCADVLLGHDLMKLHSGVDVSFGGTSDKQICNAAPAQVQPYKLFGSLSQDCKSIPRPTTSRRYNESYVFMCYESYVFHARFQQTKSFTYYVNQSFLLFVLILSVCIII